MDGLDKNTLNHLDHISLSCANLNIRDPTNNMYLSPI